MKAICLGTLVAIGLGSSAFAQSTTVTTTTSPGVSSYYIVQDVKTKKCTITHERPKSSSMTIVGSDGTTFKTETEAQSAMKTTKVCETN